MIDSYHHIKLDGELYHLAEDAEGEHYTISYEPLRPPNAVTVQGEATQKFQVRPDLLLWSLTDWSGGEGKLKYDPQNPNRSWQLNAVRVWEEPGRLIPGYYAEETLVSGGGATMNKSMTLVTGKDKLFGLDTAANYVYEWNDSTEEWGSGYLLTTDGITAAAGDTAVGDNDYIYWVERGTQNVCVFDGTTAAILNSGDITSGDHSITQLENYVYVYVPSAATVWEITKGGVATSIDEWTETGKYGRGKNMLASLDGKVYVLVAQRDKSMIREITPTSAAGTGFGGEIARIHGFEADAIWAHSGTLFILGRYQENDFDRTVLYLTPGGEYGSLGEVRPTDQLKHSAAGSGRMLDHFWVQEEGINSNHTLFQVDSVSGGIAVLATDEDGTVQGEEPSSIVAHRGDIFWSTDHGATTKRVFRADSSKYNSLCNAISPEHDFDLVGLKNLNSVGLACQPLPADWTVYVDYQINGSGTWVNAITYTTDSGVGTNVVVSTDSATVVFERLQMRVRFQYTGAGVPSSAPVVLGIEARAQVVQKVKVTQLVLDLSDAHSTGSENVPGSTKVDRFQATIAKDTAVAFLDGYTDRESGKYDESDVYVDSGALVLKRAGEGIGVVVLREVV